jgi:hypothetical protein
MKRRIMKYPPPKEKRRYNQHYKLLLSGLTYDNKTRNVFIPVARWNEELPTPAQVLKTEYHYAIQQIIDDPTK